MQFIIETFSTEISILFTQKIKLSIKKISIVQPSINPFG